MAEVIDRCRFNLCRSPFATDRDFLHAVARLSRVYAVGDEVRLSVDDAERLIKLAKNGLARPA